MHAAASIPEAPRLVIAALPAPTAPPIETGTKKTPRRRYKSKGLKSINVNGISSAEQHPKDNGSVHTGPSTSKRRASTGDHVNGRKSREKGSGTRSRRSISSILGEVAAPGGILSSPTTGGEEKAGDGEKDATAAGRSRKRRRQSKNKDAPVDEKTRISRRVKNVVNRIRQEQNLLDAYAGEGWKGNAREKIRPEKELQRAETQILRCKLAIRDLIKELDNLALDGSLQKSAFDEEGQIFHEEIFCAKCKSQETFTDNDIILCDGACDRGFHQECVDPPLATADIPPGDEGWLCPVCESKVDCLNFMNDFLGTDYHVEDSWERVFASAAADSERAANPSLGEDWPSEDSDDDDYDPERKRIQDDNDAEQANGGESTLERAFAELDSLDGSDSEPEASTGSGSASGSGSGGSDEDSGSGSSDCSGDELEPGQPSSQPNRRPRRGQRNSGIGLDNEPVDLTSDAPHISPHSNEAAEVEDVVPVSGKRQRIPVDYKMLHKEMFGEHDDDTLSEDDEWGPGRPGRRRAGKPGEGSNGVAKRVPTSRPAMGVESQGAQSTSPAGQQADEGKKQNQNDREQFEDGKARKLSSTAAKVLREEFDSGTNFPTRAYKEELAQRLGLSFKQVSSWFKTARHADKYGTPRRRNRKGVGAALYGDTVDREGEVDVDEIEITNGLLVEKLDEVQMKLHYLKQTLETMVANRDAASQPNGKHILYVPVAEVVEKAVEVAVQNGKL